MTEQQPWRAAVAVDLYDARVAVTTTGSGVFHDDLVPGFWIAGATLARLAAHFGIETQPVRGYGKFGNLSDMEVEIWQGGTRYDHEAKTLEARIPAPGLLELRVRMVDTQNETDTYVEHITYAGRFAVQWADDAAA